MDTCACPRTRKPAPFTKRNPPVEKRTAFAIFFAMSTSVGVQEDVVGNKKFPSPNDGRTRRGMDPRFAEIRLARGIGRDVGANALELSTANVLEILPLRRSGCCLIEVNRNLIALPDLLADMLAIATQSSILKPSMGMNGTTSAAPMRGCAP